MEMTGEDETNTQPSQSSVNSVDEITTTVGDNVRILYLYSGPQRPDDGLATCAKKLGADCTCVDREFDQEHDLLSQAFWEETKQTFSGYDSTLLSPPCSSFTPA